MNFQLPLNRLIIWCSRNFITSSQSSCRGSRLQPERNSYLHNSCKNNCGKSLVRPNGTNLLSIRTNSFPFFRSENISSISSLRFYSTDINHTDKWNKTSFQLRNLHDARSSSLAEDDHFEPVSLTEIKRFLKRHELTFEDGYTCLHVDCLFCKKDPSKKKKMILWGGGKLYINKTTGYFVCLNCRIMGTWKNLQDLIMLSKSGQSFTKSSLNFLKQDETHPSKVMTKLSSIEANSVEITKLTEEEWSEISQNFQFDELNRLAFERYEGRYNVGHIYLPIFSIDKKLLGYTMISISEKTGKVEETNVPKSCNELFGWKIALNSFSSSSKSRQITLVTSVFDVLSVASSSNYASLSLPPRFNHLPQEYLPKLEHFNEVTIWFGNNLQSWETAKTFGRKLGEKRCRLVRPEEQHPSPFIALQNKLNLVSIHNAAQIMEHKAITTFSKLREDVFSELNNCDQVAGVKWIRFPHLNKLMKGHRRGELTILTGTTGSGKTTFMSEYSLDLCMQGVNTLWGSFEIRNVRLARTMLTQFAEKNLEEHMDEYDKWADQFEQIPMYFMTFHGQQNIKAVLDTMTHAAYVYDIAHIVVDNLQFMLGVSETTSGDRFWKQDVIVAAFRKFATFSNCHVSLVMHPRKEESNMELSNNSIFGGAKASQEADNILILQDRRLTSPRGKKYLQLTKNRFSGDLGMFTLEFDKESLSFSGRKKQRERSETTTTTAMKQ